LRYRVPCMIPTCQSSKTGPSMESPRPTIPSLSRQPFQDGTRGWVSDRSPHIGPPPNANYSSWPNPQPEASDKDRARALAEMDALFVNSFAQPKLPLNGPLRPIGACIHLLRNRQTGHLLSGLACPLTRPPTFAKNSKSPRGGAVDRRGQPRPSP